MNTPIMDQLHEDHLHYLELLDLLDSNLKNPGDGAYLRMRLIMNYLSRYPDVFHHPYENVIFAEVLQHAPGLADVVESLLEEHTRFYASSQTLLEELDAVVSGHIVRKQMIMDAAQTYSTALKKHIELEENRVYPVIAEKMSARDWDRIRASLDVVQDPVYGPAVREEFKSLYNQIVAD